MMAEDDAQAITTLHPKKTLVRRKRDLDATNEIDATQEHMDDERCNYEQEQERIQEQGGRMLGGVPHNAHQLFWKARREAVENANVCYQLADVLKETPHMKDEQLEVQEAIKAFEERWSILKDKEHELREAVNALDAFRERFPTLKEETTAPSIDASGEEETVAEERPFVFTVLQRAIYNTLSDESTKKAYLEGLQEAQADKQGRLMAEQRELKEKLKCQAERQGRLMAEQREKLTCQAERQEKLMERQGKLMAEQRELMEKLKSRVAADLAKIADLAARTEWCLLAMSSLSQAEGTVAQDTQQADATVAKKMRTAKEASEILKDAEPNVRDPPSLQAMYAAILDNAEELPKPLDRKSLIAFDCGEPLRRVTRAFVAAMKNAAFMHRSTRFSPEYKKAVSQTVEKLRSMLMSAVENEQDDGCPESTMPDKQDEANKVSSLYIAGPTSQEVQGVQPVFIALLEAIGDCCQVAYAIPSSSPKIAVSEQDAIPSPPPKHGESEREDTPVSPPKNGVPEQEDNPLSPPKIGMSEQKELYGNKDRKGRRCDVTIWSRGRHIFLLFDCSMELTCEIKPGQRLDKSVVALLREARDQCLSHMSKALLHFLQFANGVGVPSHATSVIASLTHIEIIQLSLVDPGTDACRLVYKTSGPLPLVPEKQFQAWFSSDLARRKGVEELRHVDDTKELAELLYRKHSDRGMDNDGIPLGIKALYATMMCPRQKLMGPDWRDVSNSLGGLLGTGTFGMVFEAPSRSGAAVVKLSKPGLYYYIKNEATALKWLSRKGVETPASVPRLVESGRLPLTIGNVNFEVPALAMKPRGQSIYSCRTMENRFDIANCILRDIREALRFIHDQGVVHRDINDRNILLVPGENGQWKALLIDFSVACQKYEKFMGFTGTPPFVHREVHTKATWVAAPQYDETSLGFTLVVLLEGGVLPWKGLNDPGPKKEDAVYSERINRAKRCLTNIDTTKVGADVARSIEKLILLDENEFQCSFGCSELCRRGRCKNRAGRGCTVLCECYDKEGKTSQCMSDNPPRIPKKPISYSYEGLFDKFIFQSIDQKREHATNVSDIRP